MSAPARPTVSVVLLSYNRPQALAASLPSLTQQCCPGLSLEITVVDNASNLSEQIAALVQQFPGVRLIRNATNLGFTGGMNVGIAAASGQYLYLTEDDIVTADDCLAQFVHFFQSQPQAALASGILYNLGDRSIRCAGGSFVLGGVFRKVVFGAGERDRGQFAAPFAVDYVPGCMLFARTEFLKEIGGFRDDFFMYFDDLELCARIRKAGHQIVLVPAAKAYHMDAGYPTPPLPLEYHKLKNFVATYFLHAPWSVLPVFIGRYGLWALSRELLTDRRRFADTARAWLYGLRHLTVWLRQRGKRSPRRSLI